jgi:7SK snRNA methylphosphate capping enzyme
MSSSSRRPQGNAKIDARLDLIDESKFTNKRILDIGCNSGNISIAIGMSL